MIKNTELIKVAKGFDGKTFWAQARAGAIPGEADQTPTVVLTAQPALATGSDVFYALSEWRSRDLGKSWEGPFEHAETLGRRREADGTILAICDMTPAWNAATGTLLSTGHTVRYRDDKHPVFNAGREVAYSTYDPAQRSWQSWQTLDLPDLPQFANAGAGCAQRLDLGDGTILLPVYCKSISEIYRACYAATVVRCRFDGSRLEYLEHGDELTLPEPRGLYEPSITAFQGHYFLTLRNDLRGYVASGKDGLHFETPRPWCFDDGEELGSYNTQQHWVTHHQGLFLVYTRRGLDNDNVPRNRAPLMMARVDPERLVVLRDTERELVPNRGAGLGNFAVCQVNENETWVVVSEWMHLPDSEKYGSDNTIWVSRIQWEEPNRFSSCNHQSHEV